MTDPRFLGIDVGTSGVRACLIDTQGRELGTAQTALPEPLRSNDSVEQDPELWRQALVGTLDDLAGRCDLHRVTALALDATSATVLACDAAGEPLGPALMYNDGRAVAEAARIATVAAPGSAARGPHSGLAKALWLQKRYPATARLLHQADWLTGCLTGRFDSSDENNVLKLGYDPVARRWPDWLATLIPLARLPQVLPPGTPIAPLRPDLARRWALPQAQVVAGTTDSTAAFLATGADRVGQAVTSLGSTLVLKVLAAYPVSAPEYGVYSHRLGDRWLVGGASNSGGAVLRQYFDAIRLHALEARLDPGHPTGLDYYPLPGVGERFPLCDPGLRPRVGPRPADDARFLQGLLEGIAAIEHRGYRLLHTLGAPYPAEVISVGGGAANVPWRQIRARYLEVPVTVAVHQDAAYGSACLAMRTAASC
ncbi:MAG: FGGY-family carbohydrate kinase [Gammaproteobacteria bacterium]|nr:FGGY-family carbohydrate kinase [Gammaproteobacteria bacterium]